MGRVGLGVDQRGDGAHRRRKERAVGRETIGGAQGVPPSPDASAPAGHAVAAKSFPGVEFNVFKALRRHFRSARPAPAADTPPRTPRQAQWVGKAGSGAGRAPQILWPGGFVAQPFPGAESMFSSPCRANSSPRALLRSPARRGVGGRDAVARGATALAPAARVGSPPHGADPLRTAGGRPAWLPGSRAPCAISYSGSVRTNIEHSRHAVKDWLLFRSKDASPSPPPFPRAVPTIRSVRPPGPVQSQAKRSEPDRPERSEQGRRSAIAAG